MESAVPQQVETKKKISPFEKRVHEIDFARGVLILMVVIDHLFNQLGPYSVKWNLPGLNWFCGWYWNGIPREIIQPLALMAFCFLSGISCAFSRNNWKRAIEALILWALILGGSRLLYLTGWIQGGCIIDFNIIGVLAFSTLIYCFIQKKSWKMVAAMALIFFIFAQYIVPNMRTNLVKLCGQMEYTYIRPGNFEPSPNFYFPFFFEPRIQADWVPLPAFGLFFFIGALATRFIYKDKKSKVKHKYNWERPVCFIGRHTLIIYLVQFFAIMGLLALVDVIVKACGGY